METENTSDLALTLRVHPGTLGDEDLAVLLAVAPKLAARSERYAGWLNEVVEFEIARRESEALADPIEPELPRMNAARWTDRELCDAAIASYISTRLSKLPPPARKLADAAHHALVCWIAARFGGCKATRKESHDGN
ncbi:MAG: hypothetical protein AAGH88_15800 [Planctomycetota bacterium]